jgi:hypothetical protein
MNVGIGAKHVHRHARQGKRKFCILSSTMLKVRVLEGTMLAKLDTTWFVFAIAAVAMLSYLFSIALNAVLRDAGFGVVANAVIIIIGFFAAVRGGNAYGMRFDLTSGILAGLAGAFAFLFVLVLLKAAANRLF